MYSYCTVVKVMFTTCISISMRGQWANTRALTSQMLFMEWATTALFSRNISGVNYTRPFRSRWASSLVSATILDGRKLPSLRTSARVRIRCAQNLRLWRRILLYKETPLLDALLSHLRTYSSLPLLPSLSLFFKEKQINNLQTGNAIKFYTRLHKNITWRPTKNIIFQIFTRNDARIRKSCIIVCRGGRVCHDGVFMVIKFGSRSPLFADAIRSVGCCRPSTRRRPALWSSLRHR